MRLDLLKERIAREFGTPAVVIDLDRVDQNIARVQALCDAAGVANRPHIKTHKSPLLAKMQLAAGAQGITCQKLGEAEIMANSGIKDILVSYNLIGAARSGRLAALRKHADVTVCADNPVTLAAYAEAATAEATIGVMIECDTGRKRAGVETPGEAIALARIVRDTEGLEFRGLLFYPTEAGWDAAQRFHDEAVAGIKALGLAPGIISTGGTPNLPNIGKLAGATEHRAGTYIFNDRMMVACGRATEEDCALHVYATVVSRAGPERGILDSGSKTLTSDPGVGLDGFGHILEYPQARIGAFAEEHGFLDLSRTNKRPNVGEVVRIIPNHVCVVVNMVDQLIAVRGGDIVDVLPVAARGRLV